MRSYTTHGSWLGLEWRAVVDLASYQHVVDNGEFYHCIAPGSAAIGIALLPQRGAGKQAKP